MLTLLNKIAISFMEFIIFYKKTTISILSVFFFWLFCFHYTDVNQVAICRNFISGEIYLDSVAGPNITAPWVQVSRIDTRPTRICVECGCRNITCYLVSFNPKGWKDFVNKEGFRYYWLSNRFSFNFGHRDEYRGMKDILRGYAFDGYQYKFIKIEQKLYQN